MAEPNIIQLLNLRPDKEDSGFSNPMTYRVYSAQGICPTICTTGGGSHEPKILEIMEPSILRRERTDDAKELRRKGIAKFGMKQYRNRTDGMRNAGQNVFYPEREYTQSELKELIMSGKACVRELTARECFRLQGVDDDDIDKIYETGLSNRQMIALAGNSITVDVFYHILRKLYIDKGNEEQPTIFDGLE